MGTERERERERHIHTSLYLLLIIVLVLREVPRASRGLDTCVSDINFLRERRVNLWLLLLFDNVIDRDLRPDRSVSPNRGIESRQHCVHSVLIRGSSSVSDSCLPMSTISRYQTECSAVDRPVGTDVVTRFFWIIFSFRIFSFDEANKARGSLE